MEAEDSTAESNGLEKYVIKRKYVAWNHDSECVVG